MKPLLSPCSIISDCTDCKGHCNPEYGCVDMCPRGKNQSTLCLNGKYIR